ncbi:uncharacterized protein LY79DRAFT_584652 [Colletotrichum navitas]|uniref:Uncharacterized protein n=1 Tax=Colletotrichum navitas TaxID=681940 RepID=A0AAD8PLC5_9PEZI|nr:uncharacterized protein LY79DRAFT_584652 [Colletotrichum navitas]KAK1569542.1 hypothetical protein LY79DRAFT_584652 [Colletotrichum navitas]
MSSPLPRAPRTANPTHPEYLAHRVWAPLSLPHGINEQAEHDRLQHIHNIFFEAFENGQLRLPGSVFPSYSNLGSDVANDLTMLEASVRWQEKKRTPIDFIAESSQVKTWADGAAATIHLLAMQGDTKWLYREAYLALKPGGWLMHLQHHHQSQAYMMQMPVSPSHTQPPIDPVKAALQNEGFTSLGLSVGHVLDPGSASTNVPAARTCEVSIGSFLGIPARGSLGAIVDGVNTLAVFFR